VASYALGRRLYLFQRVGAHQQADISLPWSGWSS
jgi:hypothetical protein